VQRADVYRRVPLAIAPARRRRLAQLPARCALLVSSGEALSVLWQALDEVDRNTLRGRLAVASSERLQERLHSLGFTRVVRAASARPAALIDALAAHVGRGRFR
jgi:uroporphyrinogen-III synthase